jgi:hypothetical protein
MNTQALVLALAACALAASHAASQVAGAAPKTFLVLETEVGRRSSRGRGALDLGWQVGVLRDRGRSALGATAYAAFDFDVRADRPILNSRLGVLPRYRRWLSRGTSLDLSAGPVVELPRDARATLLATGAVALGWPNDIALTGRVDVSTGVGPAWFAGVRLGPGQLTQALEGEGIALAVWGILRFLEKARHG